MRLALAEEVVDEGLRHALAEAPAAAGRPHGQRRARDGLSAIALAGAPIARRTMSSAIAIRSGSHGMFGRHEDLAFGPHRPPGAAAAPTVVQDGFHPISAVATMARTWSRPTDAWSATTRAAPTDDADQRREIASSRANGFIGLRQRRH